MENQMDRDIPFGKLQKIWSVIWGDVIFLPFLVIWIYFVEGRSPTTS